MTAARIEWDERRFHRELEILPSPQSDNEKRLKSARQCTSVDTRARIYIGGSSRGVARGVPCSSTNQNGDRYFRGMQEASLHPVESAINPDTRLVATNPLYLRYIRRRGGRRGGWYYNADLCLERDRSRSSTSWIKEYLEVLWRQSWLEDSGSKQSRVWKVMEDKIRGGEGGMGGRGWWVYSHDSALRSLRTCLLNFYHEHLHFYRPPRRRS